MGARWAHHETPLDPLCRRDLVPSARLVFDVATDVESQNPSSPSTDSETDGGKARRPGR